MRVVELPSTVRDILTRPTPSVPRRACVPGEHSFIVRVLRARMEPGPPTLLQNSERPFEEGLGECHMLLDV
jgi:hypothetical protein